MTVLRINFQNFSAVILGIAVAIISAFNIATTESSSNPIPKATQNTTSDSKSSIQMVSKDDCKAILSQGGVFIFYDPSCPICKEYFPTIEELTAKYSTRERFYLVIREESKHEAEEFVNEYKPHCKVILDREDALQTSLRASVTPQAILFKRGSILYSGRIDDRYESIGKRRTIIRTKDLDDALEAALDGTLKARRDTQAVGCFLENARVENRGRKDATR